MKKKIAILGSTGSIGKTLIEILKKEKDKPEIVLLTINTNYVDFLRIFLHLEQTCTQNQRQ